jgi:hypothetical protein
MDLEDTTHFSQQIEQRSKERSKQAEATRVNTDLTYEEKAKLIEVLVTPEYTTKGLILDPRKHPQPI